MTRIASNRCDWVEWWSVRSLRTSQSVLTTLLLHNNTTHHSTLEPGLSYKRSVVVRASAQQLTIRIETHKKKRKAEETGRSRFRGDERRSQKRDKKKKSSDGRTRERLELVALASFDFFASRCDRVCTCAIGVASRARSSHMCDKI